MSIEYKIKFDIPKEYNPSALFSNLPSPIDRATMTEIYNYRIDKDGFYFIDNLVDNAIASVAFKRFVNEALTHANSVEISKP